LRKAGIKADCDTVERSVKAQMKYANKIGAKYSVILGDSEIESGKVELKEMATSEKTEIALADLVSIMKEKCAK
ncbi:MAG: histidine--tRNA ligase, partial [Anaerotignum sp.]|nr:histidine--tRNA ligase [Anaerotignum sp.]